MKEWCNLKTIYKQKNSPMNHNYIYNINTYIDDKNRLNTEIFNVYIDNLIQEVFGS